MTPQTTTGTLFPKSGQSCWRPDQPESWNYVGRIFRMLKFFGLKLGPEGSENQNNSKMPMIWETKTAFYLINDH